MMMMMIMMMMTAAIVRVHPVISSRKDGLKYKSLRFCSKDSNDGELLVDSRSNAVRDLGDRECTIVNHVVQRVFKKCWYSERSMHKRDDARYSLSCYFNCNFNIIDAFKC